QFPEKDKILLNSRQGKDRTREETRFRKGEFWAAARRERIKSAGSLCAGGQCPRGPSGKPKNNRAHALVAWARQYPEVRGKPQKSWRLRKLGISGCLSDPIQCPKDAGRAALPWGLPLRKPFPSCLRRLGYSRRRKSPFPADIRCRSC